MLKVRRRWLREQMRMLVEMTWSNGARFFRATSQRVVELLWPAVIGYLF